MPFLRIDFLLALDPVSRDVQIWTGEVSELGVAVSFQEIDDHQSCDMVMDAVLCSVLSQRNAEADAQTVNLAEEGQTTELECNCDACSASMHAA